MTIVEAARTLGVSRQYLYDLVEEGTIGLDARSVVKLKEHNRKRMLDAADELRDATELFEGR